jgi:hypothetical protein
MAALRLLPLASGAMFTLQSASSFPGMPECPRTQWTSVALAWARRLHPLLWICLTSHCHGPGSRCAARRSAACESLKSDTVFTACFCNVSRFSLAVSSKSPIPYSSSSKTSMRPVHRMLQQDFHSFLCLHTAAVPTRPLSERNPSVRHIQTPAPILACFSLALCCVAHLAAVVSSSMVVLDTGSSHGASQFMPLVVQPWSCSFLTALHICALEEGFLCHSFSLLLHAFSSLAGIRCCLESKITGAGVSPDSLISTPCRVVGSMPRMDQACRLRSNFTSSRLPSSL